MARARSVFRSLQGQIKYKTEKALLFIVTRKSPTGDSLLPEEMWFPLSQLSSIHEAYDEINGTFDVIMASEWILGEKGVLSLSGAAGVNPITSAQLTNATSAFPVKAMSDAERRMREKMKTNRLPYKDDESPVYDEDDIPF